MKKVSLKNAQKKKKKVVVDTARPVSDIFLKTAGETRGRADEKFLHFCKECIANDKCFLLPYREIAEAQIQAGDYASALGTFSNGAQAGFSIIFENEDEYEDGSVHLPYVEVTNQHLFHFFLAYAKALWVIGRREDARELLEFIASLDDTDPLSVVPDVLALTMGFGASWKNDFISGGRREHASRNLHTWLLRHAPLYPDIFVIEEQAPEQRVSVESASDDSEEVVARQLVIAVEPDIHGGHRAPEAHHEHRSV